MSEPSSLPERVRRALAGLLLAAPMVAAAITVQDDAGRSVHLARSPQRIVSLLPALTEMVCQLGRCDRLVGLDRYSSWPAQVQRLPRVGGGLDPSIEAVVALKPDLVLLAGSTRGAERLQALGVPTLMLEPRTHADVQRALQTLGMVLEADGPQLWRESSFIGQTLARLGLGNVVPASLGPFPKINPEWVVRADPDLLMIGERQGDDQRGMVAARPGWRSLRAVQQRRVCVFTPAESDVLVRPGPRMAEAAQLMLRCVREAAGLARPKP